MEDVQIGGNMLMDYMDPNAKLLFQGPLNENIHYQDQNPSSNESPHNSINNDSRRDVTNRASATLTVGQVRESLLDADYQRTITTGSNHANNLFVNEDLLVGDGASSLGLLSDPLQEHKRYVEDKSSISSNTRV